MAGSVKCQKSKADRYSRQMHFVLMAPGECRFEEIVMHFVGKWLESEAFNAILVVIDCFTKVQAYIQAKTSLTAENVATSYIYDIRRLYRLPRHNFRSSFTICLEVPQRAKSKAEYQGMSHYCLPVSNRWTQQTSNSDTQAIHPYLLLE